MPIRTKRRDRPANRPQSPWVNPPSGPLPLRLDPSYLKGTDYVSKYGSLMPGACFAYDGNRLIPIQMVTEAVIESVDTAGQTITVNGDLSRLLAAGDDVSVTGSTGNDGTYSVTDTSFDEEEETTTISVGENVASDVADGSLAADDDETVVHACTAFEIDVAESNSDADLDEAIEFDITVYPRGEMNRGELEVNFGRTLTAGEMGAFRRCPGITLVE